MGQPQRPHKCRQLDGHPLGGLNCTCGSAAMSIARATLGRSKPTAGRIRDLTGDKVGGTTLPQVASVARRYYSVELDVRTGSNVISPATGSLRLRAGRGFIGQGSAVATKGTPYQSSETFRGNHAVWVNEGRGWRETNGLWRPDEVLVYDPLADGRRSSIDEMSSWWDYDLLLEFMAKLQPWGEADGRRLGPGKWYAAFTIDTEPHAHYRYGGRKTTPFPDRVRGKTLSGRSPNVRSAPTTSAPIVDRLSSGELFVAFQRTTTGQTLDGSSVWYGDHDGKRWVHESGLSSKGGTT